MYKLRKLIIIIMNKNILIVSSLFLIGCGTGITLSETTLSHDPDLFTTFPKDFDSPFSINFTSGVIEVDSNKYEVQEFNVMLQEHPLDPNTVKLTIDVKTPTAPSQRMSVYSTKNNDQ